MDVKVLYVLVSGSLDLVMKCLFSCFRSRVLYAPIDITQMRLYLVLVTLPSPSKNLEQVISNNGANGAKYSKKILKKIL